MRMILATFLLLLSPPVAWAQTAEESIAYVIYQVENNSSLDDKFPGSTARVKQDGSSPAKYRGEQTENGRSMKVSFSVTKIDNCEYQGVASIDDGKQAVTITTRANFNNATSVESVMLRGQPKLIIAGTDDCAFREISSGPGIPEKPDGMCLKNLDFMARNPDADRIRKALAYFRTKYCAGRAF